MKTAIEGPKNGEARVRIPYSLSGVEGAITLIYNIPLNGWVLRIYDGDGAIIAGPRLVNTRTKNYFDGLESKGVPEGRLYCESSSFIPGFDDFNNGARFYYEV